MKERFRSISDRLFPKHSRNSLRQHKSPTVKILIHFLVFKALRLCLYFKLFVCFFFKKLYIPVIACIASDARQTRGEIPNMKRRIFLARPSA